MSALRLLFLAIAAVIPLLDARPCAAGARAMHFLGMTDPVPEARAVEVSPDGDHVYFAVTGGVSAYARDGSSGALTFVETEVDGLGDLPVMGESELAISPDGEHVYHAGSRQDSVSVLARDATTGALDLVEIETEGVGGVTGLNEAVVVAVSPDGAHVYVIGEKIVLFERDGGTGELTFVSALASTSAHDLKSMAISADGANAYVPSWNNLYPTDDRLAVFSRDAETGELMYQESLSPLIPNAGRIALSPDGTRLYHKIHGSLFEVYRRNPADGSVELLEQELFGLRGVDGIYSRTPDVRASNDGMMVYTGNDLFSNYEHDWNAIAAFASNEAGEVTFVEAEKRDSGGVPDEAFFSFERFALTPDGAHIYTNRGVVFAASFSGCTAEPLPACRSAGSSTLTLQNSSNDGSDRAVWTWTRGDASAVADLGHPETIGHASFCLYDESEPTAELVLGALAPASGHCVVLPRLRDCWEVNGTKVGYSDPFGTPDGLKTIRFLAGSAGKARIRLTAKGEDMKMPAFPLGLPIRAQLQSANGECWEAAYATATTSSPTKLKARSN